MGTGSYDDVPHFDKEGHIRTQEQQEQRRKKLAYNDSFNDSFNDDQGPSMLLKFLLVGGVVALAYGFSPELDQKRSRVRDEKNHEAS